VGPMTLDFICKFWFKIVFPTILIRRVSAGLTVFCFGLRAIMALFLMRLIVHHCWSPLPLEAPNIPQQRERLQDLLWFLSCLSPFFRKSCCRRVNAISCAICEPPWHGTCAIFVNSPVIFYQNTPWSCHGCSKKYVYSRANIEYRLIWTLPLLFLLHLNVNHIVASPTISFFFWSSASKSAGLRSNSMFLVVHDAYTLEIS
jgi:hypothetical protein